MPDENKSRAASRPHAGRRQRAEADDSPPPPPVTTLHSHTPLSREGSTCEFRYSSGSANILMTWITARVHTPTDVNRSYHGTIAITGAPETATWKLSMYNLGMQGRLWSVWAFLPPGAQIVNEDDVVVAEGSDPYKIPPVGTCPEDAKHRRLPIPSGVLFLKFTGLTLQFDVISRRRRHVTQPGEGCWPKLPITILSEHDTSPPPPEPGGEPGDGED